MSEEKQSLHIDGCIPRQYKADDARAFLIGSQLCQEKKRNWRTDVSVSNTLALVLRKGNYTCTNHKEGYSNLHFTLISKFR